MRAVDDVELAAWSAIHGRARCHNARAMLLVVDVGNTQTHFGTFRRRRARRALALRDRARVDRRRARRGARATCSSCAASASATSTRSIVSSTVPAARRRVAAMARALPRPRDARRRPGDRRPACRSATTTRASSAPTGSSTRSPPTSASAAPCIVVDFGTAITFDVVSAEGEYLGGVIAPGVEISMEALTERAAALPKIDLVAPRSRDRQDDRRRDPLRRRLRLRRPGRRDRRAPARRARRRDRDDRHRRARRARSSRTRTRSTRSTTCSRSPGCACSTSATRLRKSSSSAL